MTSPFFARIGLVSFAKPRRAPPFTVCASGAVALKMAQVPSTAQCIENGTVCAISCCLIVLMAVQVGLYLPGLDPLNQAQIRGGRGCWTQYLLIRCTPPPPPPPNPTQTRWGVGALPPLFCVQEYCNKKTVTIEKQLSSCKMPINRKGVSGV